MCHRLPQRRKRQYPGGLECDSTSTDQSPFKPTVLLAAHGLSAEQGLVAATAAAAEATPAAVTVLSAASLLHA